jgi:MFS family permease
MPLTRPGRRAAAATLRLTRRLPALPARSSAQLSPVEKTARLNFVLHVLNGGLITFAEALASPALIMTAFLSQLTTSNVLIGLMAPMRDAGWFLPQLFVAPWVERQSRKVNAYRAGSVFRLGFWGLLVLSAFVIQDHDWLLLAVFVSSVLFSVVAGLAGLPFLVLTAKVIPPDRRGLVFGLRAFIGGALGIAAGGLVAFVLSGQLGLTFPQNYALVFAFALVAYAASYTALGLVREQPDVVPAHSTPPLQNLRRAWAVARADRRFQGFLLLRIAQLAGTACVPFLTVYAKRVLNVSDSFIGSLVSITLASSLLSNIVWARLSDRRGNRLVMLIGNGMGVLFCALAALAVVQADLEPAAAQAVLMALFALSGALTAGINLASVPLMIESSAPEQQSLYFGLSNTVLGVVLLLTSLVGLIVDRFGYLGLFVFCGLAFGVALERTARLRRIND